jgi:hypothetical protein
VCTGLLIKWHQGTVVLTSASLVRRCNDEDIYEDKIDDDLTVGSLNYFSWSFELCDSQLSSLYNCRLRCSSPQSNVSVGNWNCIV